MVCSSFPRGLPWFRVLPSWIASYLLPPASCLLDCLGFAFCPLAVSYKPGSTVNRHSDKYLFSVHITQKWERKTQTKRTNVEIIISKIGLLCTELEYEAFMFSLALRDCKPYCVYFLTAILLESFPLCLFVKCEKKNTKFIIMKSGLLAIN